jgi:SIR2-like domain
MMAMSATKVIFTTNFDEVLETAMAKVAGRSLMAFNLEGSYAALDALNADAFPLYAKLHGDFRFRSLKNLAVDLRDNDAAIARAFLAAANRFGAVVTGYSGRDANVMRMFSQALDQANPFPGGLFWTVTRLNDVTPSVANLITTARTRGVKAGVVEVGTFDILMNRLWRQLSNKPLDLIQKVRPDHAAKVAIALPPPGQGYPLLRTNALPIIMLPGQCGRIVCNPDMTNERLREAQGDTIPECVIAVTNAVLFWGSRAEVESFIPPKEIITCDQFRFEDPRVAIAESTVMKSFFEHGLAKALCAGRPVVLRRRGHIYYAVATTRTEDSARLEALAVAVAGNRRVRMTGLVPKMDARWAEAVSIRIEERNGAIYLMLEPTIWITPNSKRELASDFIRARGVKRYNPQANRILDAWIGILLGDVGRGDTKTVTGFPSDDHPVTFTISTRTAFSRREQRDAS